MDKEIRLNRLLNENFQTYLDKYGWDLNESTTYKDYAKKFESFFKQTYNNSYYINPVETYDNYQNALYESLKTHNIKAFENKLFEYCLTVRYTEVNQSGVLFVLTKSLDEIDIIKQLCILYGYYIVSTEALDNDNYNIIIESTFGYKDVTDFIYNNCKGILYHLTTESRVHKIRQIGLIPKHLDKKVTHPGRIYFSTNPDASELQNLAEHLYSNKQRYAILKIDLSKMPNKTKLKFFIDPAYENYGVFTCENMSPGCISLLETQ